MLERALKVLEHFNTWPKEVLKRFNSSLRVVVSTSVSTHTLTLKRGPCLRDLPIPAPGRRTPLMHIGAGRRLFRRTPSDAAALTALD